MKLREGGRIVSMAVIVAVAVNTDGRRKILGITVLPSEAETFWSDFLRSLARRGLRGVQLVISDAHEGLKAAARKVLGAGWQRCRVHFQRNLLARLGKTHKRVVSAVVKTVFAETDPDQAHARWREVADSLRERFRDVAELMDEAEHDVLALHGFRREPALKAARHQPAGAREQGDQAAHQRHRHLPEPCGRRATRRCADVGAERCVWTTSSLQGNLFDVGDTGACGRVSGLLVQRYRRWP